MPVGMVAEPAAQRAGRYFAEEGYGRWRQQRRDGLRQPVRSGSGPPGSWLLIKCSPRTYINCLLLAWGGYCFYLAVVVFFSGTTAASASYRRDRYCRDRYCREVERGDGAQRDGQ